MRLIKGGIVIVSFSEVMKLMMHVNGLSDMSVLKTVVGSLPRLRTSPPGHLPPRTFPPTSLSRTFPPPGLFPPHGKHFSNYRSHCASHYIVDRYDERPSRTKQCDYYERWHGINKDLKRFRIIIVQR